LTGELDANPVLTNSPDALTSYQSQNAADTNITSQYQPTHQTSGSYPAVSYTHTANQVNSHQTVNPTNAYPNTSYPNTTSENTTYQNNPSQITPQTNVNASVTGIIRDRESAYQNQRPELDPSTSLNECSYG
jgi:hypothetical protein